MRPSLRFAALALVVLAAAGCSGAGGSESASTDTSTPLAAGSLCARLQDAQSDAVIGNDAQSAPPPTLGSPLPDEQCVLSNGDRELSFAVFGDAEIFNELAVIVPEAEPADGLGEAGICGASAGSETSGASCLFVRDAKTYVLGYSYPTSDERQGEHAAVKELALRLDRGLRDAA